MCLCLSLRLRLRPQGSILINDNEARIVERYMDFQDGVAYGIDQLLEPPGLGAYCNVLVKRTTYVSVTPTQTFALLSVFP